MSPRPRLLIYAKEILMAASAPARLEQKL